ncbi:hypothetical protein [Microlunatus speluncae]|uniref:hypothetical protein n=1 Tax=Microlunatus speluncae TaxID=2594267 RepID=UPI001266639F|nr:hypothetical protein [Microlunatus speluncae]
MKRRLIIGGGVAVIALCLIGIVAVALDLARWSWPAIHPTPWQSGKPFAPVPVGDDPTLISYATAELIRDRMATTLSVEDASFDSTYSFDDDATLFEQEKPRPPGLIAAVSAYQSEVVLPTDNSIRADSRVALYADTAARDAALRAVAENPEYRSQVVAEPSLAGASAVRVIQREGACSSGRGRSTSLHGVAALGDRSSITISLSCATAEQAAGLIDPAAARLTEAVAGLAGIEDEAIPATLFDRTGEVPVISDGSWSDRQVVVDPTAGPRALAVVPEALRSPGIQVYVEGRDEVAAFRDVAAATALLDRILTEPDRHDRQVVERPGTAADRTVCAEGYRPREPSECFSQVGRFVVSASADQGRSPEIEDQLKLLREAR